MKKLIAIVLILAVAMLLPCFAVGDVDVSGMTDHELKDTIAACAAELRIRHETTPDGILLFDAGGMRMYQTGDAYINNQGLLMVPVTICNDLDERAAILFEEETCNGWDIMSNGGAETKPKSKKKAEITFWVNDADVKEISEIESLSFKWTVFSMESATVLYEQENAEQYRFW